MSFRKTFKDGGWGSSSLQHFFADFGPFYRAFFGCFPEKDLQHKFLKTGGGGGGGVVAVAVWIFSEN